MPHSPFFDTTPDSNDIIAKGRDKHVKLSRTVLYAHRMLREYESLTAVNLAFSEKTSRLLNHRGIYPRMLEILTSPTKGTIKSALSLTPITGFEKRNSKPLTEATLAELPIIMEPSKLKLRTNVFDLPRAEEASVLELDLTKLQVRLKKYKHDVNPEPAAQDESGELNLTVSCGGLPEVDDDALEQLKTKADVRVVALPLVAQDPTNSLTNFEPTDDIKEQEKMTTLHENDSASQKQAQNILQGTEPKEDQKMENSVQEPSHEQRHLPNKAAISGSIESKDQIDNASVTWVKNPVMAESSEQGSRPNARSTKTTGRPAAQIQNDHLPATESMDVGLASSIEQETQPMTTELGSSTPGGLSEQNHSATAAVSSAAKKKKSKKKKKLNAAGAVERVKGSGDENHLSGTTIPPEPSTLADQKPALITVATSGQTQECPSEIQGKTQYATSENPETTTATTENDQASETKISPAQLQQLDDPARGKPAIIVPEQSAASPKGDDQNQVTRTIMSSEPPHQPGKQYQEKPTTLVSYQCEILTGQSQDFTPAVSQVPQSQAAYEENIPVLAVSAEQKQQPHDHVEGKSDVVSPERVEKPKEKSQEHATAESLLYSPSLPESVLSPILALSSETQKPSRQVQMQARAVTSECPEEMTNTDLDSLTAARSELSQAPKQNEAPVTAIKPRNKTKEDKPSQAIAIVTPKEFKESSCNQVLPASSQHKAEILSMHENPISTSTLQQVSMVSQKVVSNKSNLKNRSAPSRKSEKGASRSGKLNQPKQERHICEICYKIEDPALRERVASLKADQTEVKWRIEELLKNNPGVVDPAVYPDNQFKSTVAAKLKWGYLQHNANDQILRNQGFRLVEKPKTYLQSAPALFNLSDEPVKKLAPAIVSKLFTKTPDPLILYDGVAVEVIPHETAWPDLRSDILHPDYLPPIKLAEHQACETAGYAVWRADRGSLMCTLPNCGVYVHDDDPNAVVCPGCGPFTRVRYCSKKHRMLDICNHWHVCGNSDLVLQMVVDPFFMNKKVLQICPMIPEKNDVKSIALHRQKLTAMDKQGHYSLFHEASSDYFQLSWPKFSNAPHVAPEMNRRAERVLNLAFLDTKIPTVLDYLFRILCTMVNLSAGLSKGFCIRILRAQFLSEFGHDVSNIDPGSLCECQWEGAGFEGTHVLKCPLRGLDPDIFQKTAKHGVESELRRAEALYWILKANQQQHPNRRNWRERAKEAQEAPDELLMREGFAGWGYEENNIL